MFTKVLLTTSSLLLGLLGLVCTFMPQELASLGGTAFNPLSILAIQLTGAMGLAFAMLNWMLRKVPMGGIYGRPLALANFLFYVMASISLFKTAAVFENALYIWLCGGLFSLFALGFAYILFWHPSVVSKT